VLEELHLLGRNPHATKVLRQIRGGLEKTPEGLLLMPTTMPTTSRPAPSRTN
jgi:phage terminase large subunit-like protein